MERGKSDASEDDTPRELFLPPPLRGRRPRRRPPRQLLLLLRAFRIPCDRPRRDDARGRSACAGGPDELGAWGGARREDDTDDGTQRGGDVFVLVF